MAIEVKNLRAASAAAEREKQQLNVELEALQPRLTQAEADLEAAKQEINSLHSSLDTAAADLLAKVSQVAHSLSTQSFFKSIFKSPKILSDLKQSADSINISTS